MTVTSANVIVVGVGPAGASLATGLAREGIAVRLIDGGFPNSAFEGYSEKTIALMTAAQMSRTVESLLGPVPRIGHWGDRDVKGSEWIADRQKLHGAMRADALAAGVEIVSMRWSAADTRSAIAAGIRIVVDATGRHGRAVNGPRLLSMASTVPSTKRDPHSRVGTWRNGWFWIADDGNRAQIQLVGQPRANHPATWIMSLLSEHPSLASFTDSFNGPFTARAAHARLTITDDPLTKVGDAALAIDPLSGHGAYEALQSAKTHLAALRTVLSGGDVGLVREYLRQRRAEIWRRTLLTATGFYQEPTITSPFWQSCRTGYERVLAGTLDTSIQNTQIVQKPVLDNGYICERPVIVTPVTPRGAWRVAGVPVVELYDFLRARGTGPRLLDEASNHFGCPTDAVATAMHWLTSTGLTRLSPGNST